MYEPTPEDEIPSVYPLLSCNNDEYKHTTCFLTNKPCDEDEECRTCEIARKEKLAEAEELKNQERDTHTIFNKSRLIDGEHLQSNSENVIALGSPVTMKRLQDKSIFSSTPRPYDPFYLKQYAKELRKLRKYNNFPIPDEIYSDKDKPAVFVWGSLHFVIAPYIE
jgi:hypothetical protein